MSDEKRIPSRSFLASAACVLILATSLTRCIAGELSLSLAGPTTFVKPGDAIRVWINVINPWAEEARWTFPRTLDGIVRANGQEWPVSLSAAKATDAGEVRIAAQGFVRREYILTLPDISTTKAWLEIPGMPGTALALTVEPATPARETSQQKSETEAVRADFKAEPPEPVSYFKKHFFPYEPFYFVAGPDSPNAKFQISFKYRLVDDRSGLAEHAGFVTNFFAAYTQTSLWDWNAYSAPFEDSSYKPEFLLLRERLLEPKETGWLRLDLQGGVQHESNGRDGDSSRSLNIAYFRPALILGTEDGWQFSISPRAWVYLPDLDDNPDLPDYRGHADLRLVVGKQNGVQLAAYLRAGDSFDHGSLQLDLTFPLREIRWAGLTWCIQAQYFTGYGESLLHYNERSEAYRFGFSIYR